MDDKIIATFCLCDDLLKAMHHPEDRQCQMNDAEIMTTACIASLFFRGNHESARALLQPIRKYLGDLRKRNHVIVLNAGVEPGWCAARLSIPCGMCAAGMTRQIRDGCLQGGIQAGYI